MADRDNQGRFLPGNPGSPGRPKRETEQAILNAISNALSPEEITAAIREALALARAQKSARGIVAIIELCSAYSIGKPVARIETNGSNVIEEALEHWRVMKAKALEDMGVKE